MQITDVSLFLDYYTKVRLRTMKLVTLAPPEHIEWQYKEGKFSIGDTIRHIAATERNLYAEVITGNKSCYAGCGSELANGYNQVIDYINTCHKESVAIFSNIDSQTLQTKCVMPGGAKISIASALRLLVEHEIHHRGQLYIYLGMLGVNTPPIFGLTSEEVIGLRNDFRN